MTWKKRRLDAQAQRRLAFVIIIVAVALVFVVPSYPRQRLMAEWQAYQYFKQLDVTGVDIFV